MKKKIFIYGSCVSRDAFNFPEAQDKFELVGYCARSSLASVGSLSIDVDHKLLSNIQSNFQRKMVENDMTKQLLNDIVNIDFDILLIDLIDERFDLLEVAPNRFITYSNIYADACNGLPMGRIIKKLSSEYMELWLRGLNRFYSILREHNLINKVIINQVRWAFPFKREQNSLFADDYIQENNKFLRDCYIELNALFPSNSFLVFGESLIQQDLAHRWGASPFHYIKLLYHAIIQMLDYKMIQIDLKVHSGKLKVALELDGGDNIEFAYYLLVNGIKRDQIWYQSEKNVEFDVSLYSGVFSVSVFIKAKNYDCKRIYSSDSIYSEQGNYDLIQWGRQIYQYCSVGVFLHSDQVNSGIHSIKLTSQMNLDILIDGLEYLDLANESSFGLVVFGGAINERHKKKAPFFSGLNVAKNARIPLISISDPAFLLSNYLDVGWFIGGEQLPNLMNIISDVLQHISKLLSINLIVIGGSAGGFAALSLASIMPNTDYVIFNPQVKITNYYLRFVKNLVEICFPSTVMKLVDSNTGSEKKMVEALFATRQVKSDLSGHNLCGSNRLLYLQNSSDNMHVENHAKLFIDKMQLQSSNDGLYQNHNSCVFFGNWGSGHASIPADYLVAVIDLIKRRGSLQGIVCDLEVIDRLYNPTANIDI